MGRILNHILAIVDALIAGAIMNWVFNPPDWAVFALLIIVFNIIYAYYNILDAIKENRIG